MVSLKYVTAVKTDRWKPLNAGHQNQTGTGITSDREIMRKAATIYRESCSGNIKKSLKTDRIHKEIG
jgi:hypothetical protein